MVEFLESVVVASGVDLCRCVRVLPSLLILLRRIRTTHRKRFDMFATTTLEMLTRAIGLAFCTTAQPYPLLGDLPVSLGTLATFAEEIASLCDAHSADRRACTHLILSIAALVASIEPTSATLRALPGRPSVVRHEQGTAAHEESAHDEETAQAMHCVAVRCATLLRHTVRRDVSEMVERFVLRPTAATNAPTAEEPDAAASLNIFATGVALLLVEGAPDFRLARVLSPAYACLLANACVEPLLVRTDREHGCRRGIVLADQLLGDYGDIPDCIGIHSLVRTLGSFMVQSPRARERAATHSVLARLLTVQLEPSAQHSALIMSLSTVPFAQAFGAFVTLAREQIRRALDTGAASEWFGAPPHVWTLVSAALDHRGHAETDPGCLAAIVSLLRYVLLRDQANVTGIWSHREQLLGLVRELVAPLSFDSFSYDMAKQVLTMLEDRTT